jgi:hypothetical protein
MNGAQESGQARLRRVRVDTRVIVAQAQLAQHREALCSEGLVQLDHVDLVELQTGQSRTFIFASAGLNSLPRPNM